MGRPTLYSDEMLQKAQEYLANCVDKLQFDEDGKVLNIGVNLPKAEGLARYLGVHRDTLYEWAKKHAAFSDILEAINQEQVERLINAGLAGRYNPTIAKLVLAKHGYKDSIDHTSGDEPIKSVNVIVHGSNAERDAGVREEPSEHGAHNGQ